MPELICLDVGFLPDGIPDGSPATVDEVACTHVYSYGPCSYCRYGHGLYSSGLYSYGLCSYGQQL